jgi:2,3-dihydroxybenzoate decarboxylase
LKKQRKWRTKTTTGLQEKVRKPLRKVPKRAWANLDCLVKKNPARFGALAALSMHSPEQAAQELTRAVKELGMFGGLVNDFQSVGEDGSGREFYDTEKYLPFWKVVQDLDVPIYFHPRWPPLRELESDQPYGARRHLLGAGVSFHLELSFHIYAMCSSGLCH